MPRVTVKDSARRENPNCDIPAVFYDITLSALLPASLQLESQSLYSQLTALGESSFQTCEVPSAPPGSSQPSPLAAPASLLRWVFPAGAPSPGPHQAGPSRRNLLHVLPLS